MAREMTVQVSAGSGRSRAVEVADLIAQRSQKADPNTHLGTKQSLCKEIGVAPGTLNESLRMLEAQGLITMRTGPGGGVFAAEPDPFVHIGQAMIRVRDDARSVAQSAVVRNALEPEVVLDAALNRSEEHLALLRERMRVIEARVDEDLGLAHAIWDFHRAVYAAADNEVLASICRGLLDHIAGHAEAILPKTPEQKRTRVEGHRALLEAIESGDPDVVAEAMELHEEAHR
ncbi:FCD domain-containing protein [Brevibacterium sp. 2SA]|uniref:FadR/GntR family transcriptional regulator n=1 Tax=Brevibacterium sp. 2SA TaxID=2502198 RepID=UPI0010F72F40|nr:FCD domain-containing protein [Brevibacterium sp. 2SA]